MKGYYYSVTAQLADGNVEHFGFFSRRKLTHNEVFNTVLAVSEHPVVSVKADIEKL